jgi:hypothetical protein
MLKKFFERIAAMPQQPDVAKGIELAKLAADKAGDEWKAAAYQAFVDYARRHKYFTTEDVRASMNGKHQPREMRAWGHIAVMARRNGIVSNADLVRGKHSQGRFVTLWHSAFYP